MNLGGTFRCAQRFGRDMLAQGSGSIVNVASILGVVGVRADPAGELHGVEGRRREPHARAGGAVGAPRRARERARAGLVPDRDDRRDVRRRGATKWMRQRTPMGRAGRVEELVGPLLFLARDAASYVTGQILLVDGGWTCV